MLQTTRLNLRPWRTSDADAYAALQGDPIVRRFFPAPLRREQAEADLAAHMDKFATNGFGMLAAELKSTGDFVGLIGIGRVPDIIKSVIPSQPEIEIGWVINHSFWGQGLAPEGATACRDYAFQTLECPEIVAFTAAINTPSQRVMEKIGLTRAPEDDYLHPRIPEGHPLRPHVLYRMKNPAGS
ncbi:GNAT family N-acetyltransferase [Pelagibacterium luteolum]|uniref:Protein N-acetyltransferase, RimJ/RimL family n=1 Tax=Pelagibacterium luteolum TaxID=440168 RepID=A0A1G7UIA4_9HYPH|nr:GNAT family N-acetyltransferase [Pelagibacterium luteolum]SDG47078.1 Protein N-acetyltransferase, RimJ/RimL family [Pelagibacterium luteolum]